MQPKSIRFRLLILITCIVVLPVVSITWMATQNTRESVEKEVVEANLTRMDWADQYLWELTEQLNSLFYTLQIDQRLMNALHESDAPSLSAQMQVHSYIQETLNTVFYAYSRKIDELTMYSHASGKAVSVSFTNSGKLSNIDIDHTDWQRLNRGPISMYFKRGHDGVYAYRSINRFEDQELLGGISVKINRQVWQEAEDILTSEPEGIVVILNDENELLSQSMTRESRDLQQQIVSNSSHLDSNTFLTTADHYLWAQPISGSPLTIAKLLPRQVVLASAEPTIRAGLITGAALAIGFIFLGVWISLRFSHPIVQLAQRMRTSGVHAMDIAAAEDMDELQTLEQGYESILRKIKGLVEDEYNRELELKSAQLKTLQAQINPHFLNNTLNLIGGMALSSQSPEIYDITQALGELYRYAIASDSDLVRLQDELAHTRNYLFIQERRFANRCHVTMSIDQSLHAMRIPRFSLQPIVENAFEHGLQGKEGPWVVILRVTKGKHRLVISIKDNGAGMDSRRLQQVRSRLESSPSSQGEKDGKASGIGLPNVNSRIKLFFGPEYGIRFFSKSGHGTLVTMVLPCVEEVQE